MATIALHNAHIAISKFENGMTSTGSLSFGSIGSSTVRRIHGTGRLSAENARLFSQTDNIQYVVYSYGTPIMWVYLHGECPRCVCPSAKYSRTTTRHQKVAYRGWCIRTDPDMRWIGQCAE